MAMLYRRLGRTESGLRVELRRRAVFVEARGAFIATVHAAIDAGINLIDTAGLYDDGESERALGEALHGHSTTRWWRRKTRPYAGWGPADGYTGTPEVLVASARQAARLRRDRLDIFLGHGMRTQESCSRFMCDGCYEAMVRLREQGKVRFIGISELSEGDGAHEVLQQAIPTGAFDVVMLTLNMLLQTAGNPRRRCVNSTISARW